MSSIEKKELIDHIYDTPDTYAGGSDIISNNLTVFEDGEMITKTIDYIPVLYNMFNEILVNARDHAIRLKTEKSNRQVTCIKVVYNPDNGEISIYNNGDGILVDIHPKEKVYNPELVFGHLLTSTNYNKNDEKIVGGKNGYGAKIVNIFSTSFKVETSDSITGNLYKQIFTNNMKTIHKPVITKCKKDPYTKLSWIADFNRFGIEKYSDDMISLMIRRVYDIAGITDNNISVYYNNIKIKIKSFLDYINLYPGSDKIYEKISDRWEVAIGISENDKFEQISFVNGISTSNGGIHVDVIVKQITTGIINIINKKYKKDIPERYVKNYLSVSINSVIVNPSFDSQTKERLITPKSKFGSSPILSDSFIKKFASTGIVDKVLKFSEFKEKTNDKKTNGSKVNKITGIPKLDDANWAGTRKSNQCTLILTEGDSAKTMAISGLSVIGRDKYGIFPLRGKVLNVKDASNKQITDNTEITHLKKILGLQCDKEYTNISTLRYGKIMIMTDQDHDGSHIKGLVINIFHTLWPSLLKIDGFITSMITPIVKVTHNKKCLSFYNLDDYDNWKIKTSDYKRWKCKYYKGLGTSTAEEAKEYFIQNKQMMFIYDDSENLFMNLAFKKDEANSRKQWLYNYDKTNIIDSNQSEISIRNFINKELIHFSNSDTKRSIGSVFDGLKPSQRKILFSCFKRKLFTEIRVAQLAGYVSENAAYHHGEASLQSTIIGMAQIYVGTNNINLLKPNGQFGSRIMGGADAASPRYIHTELNPIVSYLFPESDFPILKYLEDDGLSIEPNYYLPIIPLVLVNGMVGIGTGFSTNIPQYNPIDIINNIQNKLSDKPYTDMIPWYRGFNGKITSIDNNKFITFGVYNIINNDTIVITELPIGTWTQNYKILLDSLIYNKQTPKKTQCIVSYEDHSTDSQIRFVIKLVDTNIDIDKAFKLTSTKNTNNMHLYDSNDKINKYDTVFDIMDDYYTERLSQYNIRKIYILDKLDKQITMNRIKMKFIIYVIEDKIIIYKNKKDSIIDMLIKFDFEKVDNSYNYLLNLPLTQFTHEKIQELQNNIDKLTSEYNDLELKNIKDIWSDELISLINNL